MKVFVVTWNEIDYLDTPVEGVFTSLVKAKEFILWKVEKEYEFNEKNGFDFKNDRSNCFDVYNSKWHLGFFYIMEVEVDSFE